MADETTDLIGEPLDPAGQVPLVDELDEPFPPPRDLSREAALAAAGLSVLAGVLCVVAPFRAVYTLRASDISASFDGWGRYDLASGSQHGPRYGIVLTVAALVLVVAAATRLRGHLRPVPDDDYYSEDPDPHPADSAPADPTGDDRIAAGVGIAGSALLLGVLGSVTLSIESTVSNAEAIAATGRTATAVEVGAMPWFLVGAWVLSVVALYAPWLEARRRG